MQRGIENTKYRLKESVEGVLAVEVCKDMQENK